MVKRHSSDRVWDSHTLFLFDSMNSIQKAAQQRFPILLLFMLGAVLLSPHIASAQSWLDVTAEWRFERTLDEEERTGSLFEIGACIGLSKTFVDWITFSGHLALVYAGRPEGAWKYAYQNSQTVSTYHVWGIGMIGEAWIHMPQAYVGLTGGIHARSFFMPTRSGIFRVDAYVGIASRLPFDDVLKGAVIGVRCFFSLVDDFETVFHIQSKAPSLSLVATFQF